VEFWETKFEQNVRRDRRNEAALRKRGWRIIRIWECRTGDPQKLQQQLVRIFN